MDRHYFTELLQKYHKGEATKEEVQFLVSYYGLFQYEPEIFDFLTIDQQETLKTQIQAAVWENIARKEQPVRKLRRMNAWAAGLTAAAMLLMIFSVKLIFKEGSPLDSASYANMSHLAKGNHVITLADGSTVILNSGSKLTYPSSFDGMGKREVFLDGQAFFDVKRNPSSPFIVHAGKLLVTVLGTAFNIKAFPVEEDITVTVKRGKVKVADSNHEFGTIIPSQQIVYNKERENAVMQLVTNDGYLDWKAQDLLFDNLTVSEAAALMEDRFGVKIVVQDSTIRSERFTASFPKNETLEQALNIICEFNGAVYHYDKARSLVLIKHKSSR